MYYNIPYKYTVPGTNIHWITFLIIAIEAFIFFYQLIHWLSRPSDKTRFWYLLFVFLMLIYNIVGGLFVDARLPIPIEIQLYIEVFVCLIVTIYFAFYVYKGLNIRELKFYTWKGSLFFLIIPFLIVFVLVSKITGNVKIALAAFVLIICSYGLYYLIRLYKHLYNTIKDKTVERFFKERYVGVVITITFWVCCMSCFTFYNVNQYTEHLTTNVGFLIMSYIFIRQSIVESRKEYHELQNMNEMLMQKVKERTNELEYAIEQKTNTFISLTHEIRTPLTLINNYLEEYIEKNGKTEELAIIKDNVGILIKDVNTFFKEEKFLKGLSTYNHDQVINFSKFLAEKIVAFKLSALKKGVVINGQIDNNILIKSAPDALDSIVNNLIDNAIKFTNANGVINTSLTTNSNKILFSVKDTGCGIPENLYKKIFDPYFQIDNKNNEGIGIGLSIVDNCVKSLSGKVTVKSKENEGSEFIIEFNLHRNDHFVLHEIKASIPDNALNPDRVEDSIMHNNKPFILVIEDHPDMLSYLRDKLTINYNVYVAQNGKIALERLKGIQKLDLIISDVMMEEMDGISLLRTISDDPDYCHIPFLFLTANTTAQNKHIGYSLGAIDYIQKPFNIQDLLLKVEAIIANNKKQIDFVKNIAFNNLDSLNKGKTRTSFKEFDPQKEIEANSEQYGITKREKDIILLIEKGFTYKEISLVLFISEKTVQKHCENIFNKVQVNSRLELIKKLLSK